jgi:hypothetical protein
MRNRRRTIESLRRLAERPGTTHEGIVAAALLERLAGGEPTPKPFRIDEWPRLTPIFYSYWCYKNARGIIVGKAFKMIEGQWWVRIKFAHLKTVRIVPVTSAVGCHISKTRHSEDEANWLYFMGRERVSDWIPRDTDAEYGLIGGIGNGK